MYPEVRTYVGVPPVTAFGAAQGTPIVIDTSTGTAYFLGPGDVVTAIGGGGGGGTGTVTHTAGPLTQYAVVVGNGAADETVLASLGTAGQILTSAGPGAPPVFSANAGGPQIKGAAWDGAGFAIVSGTSLADVAVYCPQAKTITKVTVLTRGGTGSCVIDIWKAAYGSYPPTVANTITAAAKPTISSATKYQSSTLTGWTTSVSAGDVLMFHVDSTSTFTYLEIILELS